MSAQLSADGLLFRLEAFQRKLASARGVVARLLATSERPMVAFSGGKDSLVTSALVAAQRPGIDVVFGDEELIFPGTLEYVEATCERLGATLHITTGGTGHAGWFDSWRMPPFWREPPVGMHWIGPHSEPWQGDMGFDAVVLGLRAQENARRRRYLGAKGRLHTTRAGVRCNPLATWTVDEVWAAIAGLGLVYHPAYDVLAGLGLPREKQRIGPLPLTDGWVLRRGWPALYERLVARYGPHWVA